MTQRHALEMRKGVRATPLHRIVIRLRDRMLFVPADEIDWIESAKNYAVLHVGQSSHVVRESLDALEKRCTGVQFVRISRMALVNPRRVREIITEPAGHVLLLATGTRLPIRRGIRGVLSRIESA